MSAWGVRLNPWGTSYSSLECEQMRFIHKAFCEAMEIGEEDLPIQLKMDDKFYPTYRPTVSDFDEHTFMRKMQDVVGLLRNPAEAIISTICAYQRERYERFSFAGYINDPRTLLLEEFKDWAMRTLAPASCTTESILNDVRRRHAYVLRLQHGQQGLFQAGSGERSLLGTLKDVRNVIETRILPSIEAERAHSSAREQLHTLEARGTDGLMHGVQFLFYVLRNTPNTPADCTISHLRAQQHTGMKDAMQTKSGQMLQVLLTTPSFQTLFPESGSRNSNDSIRALQLTAQEQQDMQSTAVFCDSDANPQVPSVLTRSRSGSEHIVTPVDFLSQGNSGVVPLRQESAAVAYDTFTRLHALLKLLADLLVSCRKARQLAGPGGDLLVYGPGGEEVRRLMQSLEIVQSEISRLVTSLTQMGVRELDRLKPNQEKAWRWSFSKVLPLENYLAHDFGACVEPIQLIYANADPLHVQKIYRKFRQATGMWVEENHSICRQVHEALGATFTERLPSTRYHEIDDSHNDRQIELLENEEEKDNTDASTTVMLLDNSNRRRLSSESKKSPAKKHGVLMLGNGEEDAKDGSQPIAIAAPPRSSRSNSEGLFSSAAALVSWVTTVNKTDSSSSKKRLSTSPLYSESDEEDADSTPLASTPSSGPHMARSSTSLVNAGVLDVLLLVRQSIQRVSQLSWGLRTSFHTSSIDEGDFDAFIVLCSIYQVVNVQCSSDLLIRLRHHRARLAQLLKRHISSVLSCIVVLQARIIDEQKAIPGMSMVYRRLESVLRDFEADLDALKAHFRQILVDCGQMKEGILSMPLMAHKEDNTGVSATMYAYNSINALTTKVAGRNNAPSSAILSHGEYMRQINSQMDLHWNSLTHLLQSLKGALEAVGTVTDRLREYAKDSRIVVPPQQLDYIFEFNYDGFFRQSTKDLQVLVTTFDGIRS